MVELSLQHLLIIFLLWNLQLAFAVMVRQCPDASSNCCPNNCGGETRGVCAAAVGTYMPYSKICQCFANYDGLDCTGCKPGYEGPNCSRERVLRIRRPVVEYTEIEWFRLFKVFKLMKETPHPYIMTRNGTILSCYDTLTYLHNATMIHNSTHQHSETQGDALNEPGIHLAHQGPAFVTWHRYLLLQFEQLGRLVSNDSSFTIPFVDWTDPQQFFRSLDMFGGDGAPITQEIFQGPFAAWTTLCNNQVCQVKIKRDVGRDPEVRDLPTQHDVNLMLSNSCFDKYPWNANATCCFRNNLEGACSLDGKRRVLHNYIHRLVGGNTGGDMTRISTAPNDPFFYLHHSFVDLLYAAWQQLHPSVDFTPESGATMHHNKFDYMAFLIPLRRNIDMHVPVETLGYTYQHALISSPWRKKPKLVSPDWDRSKYS